MRIDISFLPALATAFMLTFARVGAMVMLLPGVGELSVPSRVRLTIALALTAILLPAHQKAYAVDLKTFGPVLVLLFQELIIGAVLGLTARCKSRVPSLPSKWAWASSPPSIRRRTSRVCSSEIF